MGLFVKLEIKTMKIFLLILSVIYVKDALACGTIIPGDQENSYARSLAAPLNWDAALDNLVERIDKAIPELGLLTDRQGIIATTDINGHPCKWPKCNLWLGLARTVEQP